MGEDERCIHHSGFDARITQLEKNDEEIFPRIRDLEKAVWQAAASCGVITAIGVALIQHYWK